MACGFTTCFERFISMHTFSCPFAILFSLFLPSFFSLPVGIHFSPVRNSVNNTFVYNVLFIYGPLSDLNLLPKLID